MGRHFEVRAAAMQKTANAKAKIYSRYSKEILVAAKNGDPNPDMNQTLKKAIDRAKANNVPADESSVLSKKQKVVLMKVIQVLVMKDLDRVLDLQSSLIV